MLEWLATFWADNRDAILVGLIVGLPTTVLALVAIRLTPRPLQQKKRYRNRRERVEQERERHLEKLDNVAGWVAHAGLRIAIQFALLSLVIMAGSLLYLLDRYVVDLFPPDAWSKFTPPAIALNLLLYFLVSSYQFISIAVDLFVLMRPGPYLRWLDRQLEKIERDEKLLP